MYERRILSHSHRGGNISARGRLSQNPERKRRARPQGGRYSRRPRAYAWVLKELPELSSIGPASKQQFEKPGDVPGVVDAAMVRAVERQACPPEGGAHAARLQPIVLANSILRFTCSTNGYSIPWSSQSRRSCL